MKPSRTSRLVAAVIAVISLLFTQLALASYACPGMSVPAQTAMAADMDMASMENCTGMDKAQPSLCHAYVHTGHQSLDKPDLPQVQPFHPLALIQTVILFDAPAPQVSAIVDAPSLVHATAPPIAIRNCCFRI